MPHRAPYRFFEKENGMHTERRRIWAFGDGDKGAISVVAHFKVPEITFLGRETPKSVVLWSPPPLQHRQHFYPLGVQNTKNFLAMGSTDVWDPGTAS